MAYTLIGGTAGGTVLTLLFLPALYAIWFKVKPEGGRSGRSQHRRLFGAKSRHRIDGHACRWYFTCSFASLTPESGDCGMVKAIS
jgi:hypothetical protein